MAQSVPYPIQYIPQHHVPQHAPQHAQYYNIAPHQHPHLAGQVHLVTPPARAEQPQRKRPKYTRSKTGCLTCRMKKIKCDETKPHCQRCSHGQRECTWPEGAVPKKKATTRKNSIPDDRPSTADSSSHVSDASSTSRDYSTVSRDSSGNALGAVGMERRHSEPMLHSFPLSNATGRRRTLANIAREQSPQQHLSASVLGSVPEMGSSYPSPSSSAYSVELATNNSVGQSRNNSRPSTANSLPPSRYHGHHTDSSQYNPAPLLTNMDPNEPYASTPSSQTYRYLPSNPTWAYQFNPNHERGMVGDHLSHDQRSRIQ